MAFCILDPLWAVKDTKQQFFVHSKHFFCFYNDSVKWLGTICEFLSILSGKKLDEVMSIGSYQSIPQGMSAFSRLCWHAIEIGIIELSLIQFPIFPLLPSSRPSYNSKQILPVIVHLSHWRPFLLYLYVFGSHVFHASYWEWLLTESVTVNTMDTQMLC